MANIHHIASLNLTAANQLANLAIAQAENMGLCIHVHVTDHTGETLAYQRMPGAPLPAGDIALKKAATAANYKTATDIWKTKVSKRPLVATSLAHHPKITLIGGGCPVVIDNQVVGAIGVAGALEDQDIEITKAALAQFTG